MFVDLAPGLNPLRDEIKPTLAIVNGIGLGSIANVIHPYPTQAEAIRRVAAAYNRTRLTPRVAALLKRWLKWQRG